MLRLALISLTLLCVTGSTIAQNGDNRAEIDSLKLLLKSAESPNEKADLHKALSHVYMKDKDSLAITHAKLYVAQFNNDDSQLEPLFHLAEVLTECHEYNRSIEVLKRALKIAREKKKRALVARAYMLMAGNMEDKGQLREAREQYLSAVHIARAIHDNELLAQSYNRLGVTEKNSGNYSKAMRYYFQALELYNDIEDPSGVAKVLSNIGVIYKYEKDYKKALDYYTRALKIRRTIGDQEGVADCFNNIGVLYKNQEQYDRALGEYLKALKLHREINNERKEAKVLHNIANIYQLKDDMDMAIDYFRQSQKIRVRIGDGYGLALTYGDLGDTYLKYARTDSAEHYLQLAMEHGIRTGSPGLMMGIYENLTNLYALKQEPEKFQTYWERYRVIRDTLMTLEKTQMVYELESNYELKQEEAVKEVAETQQQNEAIRAQLEKERQKLEDERAYERRIETISYAVAIGLLALLALALYLLFRSAKKSRRDMEAKNQELQQTLLSKEEKEVLLKEIHHRVKNNMQIIMSLLRLQSANITDEYIRSLYSESQNRIKSMALVHEELYQTKTLTEVSVKNYLEKLVDNLILNYSLKTKIITKTDIQVTNLGIDTLIPLGLLLNEIISNSFKHAFKGMDQGEISVELTRSKEGESLELKVGDNGGGFAASPNGQDSLGYELIESLVEQLDGESSVTSGHGVHYHIKFMEQGR